VREASAEKDNQNSHEQRRNERQDDRHSRRRCGTGRACRAGQGPLEEQKTDAPKSQEKRHGWQSYGDTQEASQGRQDRQGQQEGRRQARRQARSQATRAKEATSPRPESKGAKILGLIGRAKGATLAEIIKAVGWQAHSVRGFISTAGKKHVSRSRRARTKPATASTGSPNRAFPTHHKKPPPEKGARLFSFAMPLPTAPWCGNVLRMVAPHLWLCRNLFDQVNRAALERVASVGEANGVYKIALRPGCAVDELELALLPILPVESARISVV